MATLTTSASSVYAKIAWVAPEDNGAAITAYRVVIQQGDGTMTEESTYCAGSDATVMANLHCRVPMAVLRAAPYSLSQGTTVVAQGEAYNLKGWSTISVANTGGAVVETEPVAPGAPTRVEATTDDTQVTVIWNALTTDTERGGPSTTISSYNL